MTMNPVDQILNKIEKAAGLMHLDDRLMHILPAFDDEWTGDILPTMKDGVRRRFKVVRIHHLRPYRDLPYKGGLRYSLSVNVEEMKRRAMEMTFKCGLARVPLGGAKGGMVINPNHEVTSDQELKNATEAFVNKLKDQNLIGPYIDVPAPDIGTNAKIMGWIRHIYGHRGVVTGKPIDKAHHSGGMEGREPATGYGIVKVLEKIMELRKIDKTVHNRMAIMGFGNVGKNVAKFASKAGFKIIAISDIDGGRFHADGFDYATITNASSTKDIEHGDKITNEELLELEVDILVPAAVENVITGENADKIKAQIVLEGANGPTTDDADLILDERKILVVPDILANSGGLIVSYYEWSRNVGHYDPGLPVAKGLHITEKEVLFALKNMLYETTESVNGYSVGNNESLRMAAYILSLGNISELLIEKYYV